MDDFRSGMKRVFPHIADLSVHPNTVQKDMHLEIAP